MNFGSSNIFRATATQNEQCFGYVNVEDKVVIFIWNILSETIVKKVDFPLVNLATVPVNQHSYPCFSLQAGQMNFVYIPGSGK